MEGKDVRENGSPKPRVGEEAVMPQEAWNTKRERQYKHIKKSLKDRGRSESTAEEIAARTVNKGRARSGEAKQSSRLSRKDISSGRRGGLRSHRGPGGRTRDQLYEEAKDLGIEGRSKMNKSELLAAVNRKRGRRSK
jgi:Rho termination factor-like protein